jgi:hypothetical protein
LDEVKGNLWDDSFGDGEDSILPFEGGDLVKIGYLAP